MPPHLTAAQKQMARRLRARGLSLRQIAREIGRNWMGESVVLRDQQTIPPRPDLWSPSPSRLQLADREEISLGAVGRGVQHGDRPADRSRTLDGLSRGLGQRRRHGVPRLAGAPARL